MVHQYSTQDEALGRHKPSGGHLAQAVEDRLELGVELLYRVSPQLMEDAPDLDPWLGSASGCGQPT